MMQTVSVGEFLRRPGVFVQQAIAGDYTTIRLANGGAAVLIDEPEWTILRQALALCLDHPEWTQELSSDG